MQGPDFISCTLQKKKTENNYEKKINLREKKPL